MSKAHPPELKKFMDKRIHLRINGSRQVRAKFISKGFSIKLSFQVEGTLCGFDPFMNLVLSDAIDFPKAGGQNKIGKLAFRVYEDHVSKLFSFSGMIVVRGNSVVMLEARDRI